MLRLMLGRAGTGKTTRLLEELCRRREDGRHILVVPEQQSHQVERLLCRMGGESIGMTAEVLSFTRLSNRVLMAAGGAGDPELDPGGRLLLMYLAIQSVASQLTVYARPSRRPAFLKAMLDTVDELKSSCVSPQCLLQAGESMEGTEGEKLRDLGLISGAYQGLTAQIAWDPRDRLTRVAEKLIHCPWAEGAILWLDGFTDFTPQQQGVLRQLMIQAREMVVTLTCDHLEEDEDGVGIFSPARRTGGALRRLAREEGIPYQVELSPVEHISRSPALHWLEQQLFSKEASTPIPCRDEVMLFQSGTPRGEVEWAAAQIRRMVRCQGLRYRDIGVVARKFSLYQPLIESIFPHYDIPVFTSAMGCILEKPILILVTAALDTVVGGYPYEELFSYLKTGLTNIQEEDVDLLENYVLTWNLRGKDWNRKKHWTLHPRGYGHPWTEEDQAHLNRLEEARQRVVEPLERLRTHSDSTGRGQAVALYNFLEEIDLPKRLDQRVIALRERGQVGLAEEYSQLWEILCGGLEQCAQLLDQTPMELEEFASLLELVLSQYQVGTIPVSLDRVTAGETTRQTGHPVKQLFFLGAEDGSLPLLTGSPGLLSDENRTCLAEWGVELHQTEEALLYRELTTVYLTCARPTQGLVVTWPSQSLQGEELRPSFLVERLLLLFSDLVVEQEGRKAELMGLTAPRPALERIGWHPQAREVLLQMPQYVHQVSRVDRAAHWERGHLSPEVVDGLYGKRMAMSASRMEQYQSCHFSYFMRYGLQATPRRRAEFSAPEYGSLIHYVLEQVLKDQQIQKLGQKNRSGDGAEEQWKRALHKLVHKVVQCYVREKLGGMEEQPPRFRYLFQRLLGSVYHVVENVVQELAGSDFRPLSLELGFGREGELPPVELTVDGVTLSISGFVDRVDGWIHEDRLYLRVVDYKSGKKSFDLAEVWNGLGLQMLLYLFTLEKRGEKLYGMPIESAGVLYLPARDVVVKGRRDMSEEERQHLVDKELTRSGLLLDDPQVLNAMERPQDGRYRFLPLRVSKSQGEISGEALVTAQRLGHLGRHIQKVLEEMARELAQGNIAAQPYWRGPEHNACQWCAYGEACHFEEGWGGECRRWISSQKGEKFWSQIEGEDMDGGKENT